MGNPIPVSFRGFFSQAVDHPRQIRAVGQEAANPGRRAGIPEFTAVEKKLLHSFGQVFPEPSSHRKVGFILRQVAQGRPARPQADSRHPPTGGTAVGFAVEIVVAAGQLVQYDLVFRPVNAGLQGGRGLGRHRENSALLRL